MAQAGHRPGVREARGPLPGPLSAAWSALSAAWSALRTARVVGLAGMLLACGAPSWRGPVGAATAAPEVAGSRLAEATPFLWPHDGELTLFWCRWRTELPIPVSLPADASVDERRALEAALHAWEGAGLGVRFVEAPSGAASLAVSLEDAAPAGDPAAGAATTADCRLRPGEDAPAGAIAAELVHARVRIARRAPPDPRGRDRALATDELAGVALHELGHALGISGHLTRDSVMVRERDAVVRQGRRALAGKTLDEPTFRALYALPSGFVRRRASVSPFRTGPADRIARLAARRGLAGPFARVGDDAARLFWVVPGGLELGVEAPDPARLAREPDRLALVTEAAARRALEQDGPDGDTVGGG